VYYKNLTDLSTVLSQFTRVTDRRTDRQTEFSSLARPRLHSMQRGKKEVIFFLENIGLVVTFFVPW